jgi:hypothetical protein
MQLSESDSDDDEEHLVRIIELKEKLSQQYPELVQLRGEVGASSAWKPDKPLAQSTAVEELDTKEQVQVKGPRLTVAKKRAERSAAEARNTASVTKSAKAQKHAEKFGAEAHAAAAAQVDALRSKLDNDLAALMRECDEVTNIPPKPVTALEKRLKAKSDKAAAARASALKNKEIRDVLKGKGTPEGWSGKEFRSKRKQDGRSKDARSEEREDSSSADSRSERKGSGRSKDSRSEQKEGEYPEWKAQAKKKHQYMVLKERQKASAAAAASASAAATGASAAANTMAKAAWSLTEGAKIEIELGSVSVVCDSAL